MAGLDLPGRADNCRIAPVTFGNASHRAGLGLLAETRRSAHLSMLSNSCRKNAESNPRHCNALSMNIAIENNDIISKTDWALLRGVKSPCPSLGKRGRVRDSWKSRGTGQWEKSWKAGKLGTGTLRALGTIHLLLAINCILHLLLPVPKTMKLATASSFAAVAENDSRRFDARSSPQRSHHVHARDTSPRVVAACCV